MKYFSILLLCCTLLFGMNATVYANNPPSSTATDTQVADRIIAVVGEGVITLSDLEDAFRNIWADASQKNKNNLPPDELKKQILEQMITEIALAQYAKKTGITVSDSQVRQALEQKQSPSNKTASRAHINRDYVNEWRHQMINQLVRRDVGGYVSVTDEDVEQAMKSSDVKALGDDYRLEKIDILIAQPVDNEALQSIMDQINTVISTIQSTERTQHVLAGLKTKGFSLKVEDMGWRHGYLLNPQLVTMVLSLNIGETSSLVRSKEGFLFFKLLDKRHTDAPTKVNKQYRVAHILIEVGQKKSKQVALKEIEAVAERISKGGDFKEMASQYSEDASKTQGGEIGWVSLGTTVPEFESAMLALPLNALSKPVLTQYGWHLIKVLEVRDEDHVKNAVRERLFRQNLDQVYQDWQQRILDATYIERRL